MIFDFILKDIQEASFINEYNQNIDSPFFRTEWLSFIDSWHGYKPIIIEIKMNNTRLGYFSGMTKRIFSIKILGSPLPGCLGQVMGFSLNKDINKDLLYDLVDQLIIYLRKQLNFSYITITSDLFEEDIFVNCKMNLLKGNFYKTWHLDIEKPLEEIRSGFSKSYRNYVNKFEKSEGNIVIDYSDSFITNHNSQLIDVYDKDGIASPNIIDKYKKLFDNTVKSGLVYSIRADIPLANNIASSIYIYYKDKAYFLTNASYKQYLQYRPNQSLMWNAIEFLKDKKVKTLDMVGPGQYKGYYGADYIEIPQIIYTKHYFIHICILTIRKTYYKMFKIKKIFSKRR